MAPASNNDRGTHLVAFLPFLRIDSPHSIAGVEFLPLLRADGTVSPMLESAVAPLSKILSGYVDRRGKAFTNCVVATTNQTGWDLSKEDFPTIRWAASLLFLAAWALYQNPDGSR